MEDSTTNAPLQYRNSEFASVIDYVLWVFTDTTLFSAERVKLTTEWPNLYSALQAMVAAYPPPAPPKRQ